MFIFTVGMTRLCKQPGGERWQRCTALHKEGRSPCFCSGILTFQDIKKIGTAHRDLLGKPLAAWECCLATEQLIRAPLSTGPCTTPLLGGFGRRSSSSSQV